MSRLDLVQINIMHMIERLEDENGNHKRKINTRINP